MKPMPPMMMPTDSWSSVVKWMQSMVLTVAHMGCIFASPGALLTNIQTLVHYSMQLSSVICNELYPFSPRGYLPWQGWRVYRGIWNHLFVNPSWFLGPSHTDTPSHTVDVSGEKCCRASINNLIHNHELFIWEKKEGIFHDVTNVKQSLPCSSSGMVESVHLAWSPKILPLKRSGKLQSWKRWRWSKLTLRLMMPLSQRQVLFALCQKDGKGHHIFSPGRSLDAWDQSIIISSMKKVKCQSWSIIMVLLAESPSPLSKWKLTTKRTMCSNKPQSQKEREK